MISIVGNIKCNESKPERVKMLIACIRSFLFLKDEEDCRFVLHLEGASEDLYLMVWAELKHFKNPCCFIEMGNENLSYGEVYRILLNECPDGFIFNFFEDHFCLLDDKEYLLGLLNHMKENKIDVCKASFHEIEQQSALNVWDKKTTEWGNEWLMNEGNYKGYCIAYGERFFLGVNFITTKEFALKFWNRVAGKTPHGYELPRYSPEWEHTVIIPSREICAAIDDPHGAYNSHLLARNEQKFKDIYDKIILNTQLQD